MSDRLHHRQSASLSCLDSTLRRFSFFLRKFRLCHMDYIRCCYNSPQNQTKYTAPDTHNYTPYCYMFDCIQCDEFSADFAEAFVPRHGDAGYTRLTPKAGFCRPQAN